MNKPLISKCICAGLVLAFCALAATAPWSIEYFNRHREEMIADRWGAIDADGCVCEVIIQDGKVNLDEWLDVMSFCQVPERRNQLLWGKIQARVVGCSMGVDFDPGTRTAEVVQMLAEGATVYCGIEAVVQHALLVAQLLKSDWQPIAAEGTPERREEALRYLRSQAASVAGHTSE